MLRLEPDVGRPAVLGLYGLGGEGGGAATEKFSRREHGQVRGRRRTQGVVESGRGPDLVAHRVVQRAQGRPRGQNGSRARRQGAQEDRAVQDAAEVERPEEARAVPGLPAAVLFSGYRAPERRGA